jgi:hypothetical protein
LQATPFPKWQPPQIHLFLFFFLKINSKIK